MEITESRLLLFYSNVDMPSTEEEEEDADERV